jgi:hypothetical protein
LNVKKLSLKHTITGKIDFSKFRTRSEENANGERGQSSASDQSDLNSKTSGINVEAQTSGNNEISDTKKTNGTRKQIKNKVSLILNQN